MKAAWKKCSADEAAELIQHNDMVAFSGFTPAGSPKYLPLAIARRAEQLHQVNQPFQIRLLTGASIGAESDDALAEACAISWRAPYQTAPLLRKNINNGNVRFIDLHLSEVSQMACQGFFGKIDVAVIEASAVTADGRISLTTGIGNAQTWLQCADKVIIELNHYHNPAIATLSDITLPRLVADHSPVPLLNPMDRIGKQYATVDPRKIVAVVDTIQPDICSSFAPEDAVSQKIADNVVTFLLNEIATGRIPPEFLPVQSGVGNINNAILYRMGQHPDIPGFQLYSEVIQDSAIQLLTTGKMTGASGSSLTVSNQSLMNIYDDIPFFADRIVLRPQEISNCPEVIHRLGIIALNVGLEFDIYGHANSTHIVGSNLMNGIGGSGDFIRNAYLSIFMAPSVTKDGKITTIVPMCTHVDHSEHSIKVIITEQGIADLRGLSPLHRAKAIINNCAHPLYRDYLFRYLSLSPGGHIRHELSHAFDLHLLYLHTGSMLG